MRHFCDNLIIILRWEALQHYDLVGFYILAAVSGGQGVASSNLATPTIYFVVLGVFYAYCFHCLIFSVRTALLLWQKTYCARRY